MNDFQIVFLGIGVIFGLIVVSFQILERIKIRKTINITGKFIVNDKSTNHTNMSMFQSTGVASSTSSISPREYIIETKNRNYSVQKDTWTTLLVGQKVKVFINGFGEITKVGVDDN